MRASPQRGVLELPEGNKWRSRLISKSGLPPIVALGKFDAMHIGHRALAVAAARLDGHPWLVSFSGMAEVMGWDTKRLPLVAHAEQPYVLGDWSDVCLGRTPSMRYLPFAEIRQQKPEEFFKLLVEDLGAQGVVAGANYRFGYKAAGTASTLQELAHQYGIKAEIVELVSSRMNSSQEKVSSSKVREALQTGEMSLVKEYLDRDYVMVVDCTESMVNDSKEWFFPKSSYQNLAPKNGTYRASVNSHVVNVKLHDEGLSIPPFQNQQTETELVRIVFLS